MKTLCAWCRKKIHVVDSQVDSENAITHGICEGCRHNMQFQMGVELQVYLDSLEVPIVVVNREGTIVTGNKQARILLQKELSEIEGYKGGEVFECAYSRLPEGCGNTMHCSGCTIRRSVMETYGTGRSFLRIPATLNQNTSRDLKKTKLLISTERLADVVLLRIDKIEAKNPA